MTNLIEISEYEILKHDFEALTVKHREVLHLVLFKVRNSVKIDYEPYDYLLMISSNDFKR